MNSFQQVIIHGLSDRDVNLLRSVCSIFSSVDSGVSMWVVDHLETSKPHCDYTDQRMTNICMSITSERMVGDG